MDLPRDDEVAPQDRSRRGWLVAAVIGVVGVGLAAFGAVVVAGAAAVVVTGALTGLLVALGR